MIPHSRAAAKMHPHRPALVLADRGQSVSYGELVERSDRAARLFASLGIAEGDTIAYLLGNHIQYAELVPALRSASWSSASCGRPAGTMPDD